MPEIKFPPIPRFNSSRLFQNKTIIITIKLCHGLDKILPSFVDEFNESETGVFLQRILPLLRAEQHDQLHHRLALLEREEALAFEQQFLAVRAEERLREERREVDHDLPEERAHRAQRRLQLLRQ